jgi:hypothetical protein
LVAIALFLEVAARCRAWIPPGDLEAKPETFSGLDLRFQEKLDREEVKVPALVADPNLPLGIPVGLIQFVVRHRT